jgi:hypothetical protein
VILSESGSGPFLPLIFMVTASGRFLRPALHHFCRFGHGHKPVGLNTVQLVLSALAIFFAMTFVAYTINKNKPENKTAPTTSTQANPPATAPPTAKPQDHPAPTAPAPKPSPKPVLHWHRYMGHPAITPEFFKVETAEGSCVVSLFLQNDGNADLTRAKLYITYESQYEVVADKPSRQSFEQRLSVESHRKLLATFGPGNQVRHGGIRVGTLTASRTIGESPPTAKPEPR